jgi:hypothetical protein
MIDSFIPVKRTKGGKRFGFVRFINVFNLDRLVRNLCTIWVGRLKLFANVARFQRSSVHENNFRSKPEGSHPVPKPKVSYSQMGNSSSDSTFANILKGNSNLESDSCHTIVLEDDCLNSQDMSMSLIGRVKDFTTLPNIKNAISMEGFGDVSIRFLGELWVMLTFTKKDSIAAFHDSVSMRSWFSIIRDASIEFYTEGRVIWVDVEGIPFKLWSDNTFKRIASKRGELLDVDDQENSCYHTKRLCILSKLKSIVHENFKISFRGKIFWIRAKEVPGWMPNFMMDSDDDSSVNKDTLLSSDDIPAGMVEEDNGGDIPELVEETVFNLQEEQKEVQSEDPFNLYDILKKDKKKKNGEVTDENSLPFPPGFTPDGNGNVNGTNSPKGVDLEREQGHNKEYEAGTNSVNYGGSGQFKSSSVPKTGGSILLCLEELIKVGQTMGYTMEGCTKDVMQIIGSQGVESVPQ